MEVKMGFLEFWDWLQFDSPDHEKHEKALRIYRYLGASSESMYVERYYKEYLEQA